MIKVFLTIQDTELDKTLVELERGYESLDMFEITEPDFTYKVATIAREELEKIRKERFLMDNPELNIGGVVDELTASTPF